MIQQLMEQYNQLKLPNGQYMPPLVPAGTHESRDR